MSGISLKRILIIQTAFIGDVVLATGLIEKLHQHYPDAMIDILVRKGNESLLDDHPVINNVIIFDKKKFKYINLIRIINRIRKIKYDLVVNIQRHFTTGLITTFSKARVTTGFDKNPLSFAFSKKIRHTFEGKHETERNHDLVASFTDGNPAKPKLYPKDKHFKNIATYTSKPYICIAPASIWYTKQFPVERWIDLLDRIAGNLRVYLLGGPDDRELCDYIKSGTSNQKVDNLCGKISFLDSAALMKQSTLNLTNDSAPLHISSAVNSATCAIFCSTVPSYGYGPVADTSIIIERKEPLYCRPCGIHGRKKCPEGHFKCAYEIDMEDMVNLINQYNEV